jgi:hypothetical protein
MGNSMSALRGIGFSRGVVDEVGHGTALLRSGLPGHRVVLLFDLDKV